MNPIPPEWRLPCASPGYCIDVESDQPRFKKLPWDNTWFDIYFQAAGREKLLSYCMICRKYLPYPTETLRGTEQWSSGDRRQKAGNLQGLILFEARIFSLAAGFHCAAPQTPLVGNRNATSPTHPLRSLQFDVKPPIPSSSCGGEKMEADAGFPSH